MNKKKCSKCGKEKLLIGFYRCNRSKTGYKSACKECEKEYKQKNKERDKKVYDIWYKKNKEKRKAQCRKYFQEHKKELIEYNKQYRKTHKEQVKKKEKERREKDSEKFIAYRKKYYKEHKEKIQKLNRLWVKKMRNTDINFKIKENVSSAVNSVLCGRKNNRQVELLIGYKIENLKNGVEKQFTSKMSWSNYGIANSNNYTWNLDHIIPISYYNFINEEEIKKCWNPRNIRPLSAIENSKRKNDFDIALVEEYDIFDLLPEKLLLEDVGEEAMYRIFKWQKAKSYIKKEE